MDFGAHGLLVQHFHNEIQLQASVLPQLTVHTNEEECFLRKVSQASGGWEAHLCWPPARPHPAPHGFTQQHVEIGSFSGCCRQKAEQTSLNRAGEENSFPWGITMTNSLEAKDFMRASRGKLCCKIIKGLDALLSYLRMCWIHCHLCWQLTSSHLAITA